MMSLGTPPRCIVCGLGGEVVEHLVVGQVCWVSFFQLGYGEGWRRTVERIPEEHLTGFESSAHLVHPCIVECHPVRFWLLS